MGLFYRRYFCIFSFLFILSSFVAVMVEDIAFVLGIVFLALTVPVIVLLVCNKNRRFLFAVLLTCLIFVSVGFLNSFLFVIRPQNEACSNIGTNPIEVKILSCEYSDGKRSEYVVKVKQIGEKSTNIRAYLYCDFPSELEYGDRIIAMADIDASDTYVSNDRSLLLDLNVSGDTDIYYKKAQNSEYFSLEGIGALLHNVRKGLVSYVNELYGEEDGALLSGFLINDRTGLSSKTESDFRRAGISHLLSVSGFHIALLLGTLELILRKIFVPKQVRCVLVAIFGIFFIALTDFSSSAVRSALMLFSVYVGFMLHEDSDSITALFGSVFLILLFSPYSIYDLGLFMSFGATLGLLILYPYLDKRLPRFKGKKLITKLSGSVLLGILRTILITVVANIFLLPILWYFFGELSLASIPSNLLLSPLSAVYLTVGALSLAVAKIPVLGSISIYIVKCIGNAILSVASFFAQIKGAVVSLSFPFVPVLVVLFTVSMAILLVLRLKHKLVLCIPALAFAVCFSICLFVFSLGYDSELTYINNKSNDVLILQKGGEVTVCDVTNASGASYHLINDGIPPYATEIENYVITHAHKNHAYTLERILRKRFIRNLYLPLTEDSAELTYVKEIYEVALGYNTNLIFYRSGESICTLDGVNVLPYFEKTVEGHSSVRIMIKYNERMLVYTDAYETEQALSYGAQSQYFLLGAHGERQEGKETAECSNDDTVLIFPNSERLNESKTVTWDSKKHIIPATNNKISITLPLS